MMPLTTLLKPRVVIGGHRVDHLLVDRIPLGQAQAFANDHLDMVATMRRVEVVVAREYLPLDVGSQGVIHVLNSGL